MKCDPLLLTQFIHLIKLNEGSLSEFKECTHAIVNSKGEGEESVSLDYAFDVDEKGLKFWKTTVNYDKSDVLFLDWKWILNSIEKWKLQDTSEFEFS